MEAHNSKYYKVIKLRPLFIKRRLALKCVQCPLSFICNYILLCYKAGIVCKKFHLFLYIQNCLCPNIKKKIKVIYPNIYWCINCKYLHLYFHRFNILYRTNEVHSSMNTVSLITAQRYGKTLMTSGIPRYF